MTLFETLRLTVRTFEKSDLALLQEILSDPAVTRHIAEKCGFSLISEDTLALYRLDL